MNRSQIPAKFGIQWAKGQTNSIYRRLPPDSTQIGIVNGAASFNDGFPPLTFTPVTAGGIPPSGADMNGVLNAITLWEQWQQAGGPITFDSNFQGKIGGYPSEAKVRSARTPYLIWQSITENNTTDPDAGGAGWQTPVFPDPVTYYPSSGLTVQADLTAGSHGANIRFNGNTLTQTSVAVGKPNKYIRSYSGNFEILSHDYASIFLLDNAGNVSNVGNIAASGQVSGAALVAGTLANPGSAVVFGLTTTQSLTVTNASFVSDPTTGVVTWTTNTNGIGDAYGIATTGFLYAGSSFSPNSYNAREWVMYVTDQAGTKRQTYRAGWYDEWNGTNGTRTWNYTGVGSQMTLDGAGNLSVLGSLTSGANGITTTGAINVTGNANVGGAVIAQHGIYPHGTPSGWYLDIDGSGNRVQNYQANWYDFWSPTDGSRYWQGYPSSVATTLMHLDGAGNLNNNGTIISNGNITAANGKLRATFGHGGDSNAAPILGDFGHTGSFSSFIMQMPNHLFQGVALTSLHVGTVGDGSSVYGASNYYNFTWATAFPSLCAGAWGMGFDDASAEEGSEMSVAFVFLNQFGGTFRVNRVSGVNNGGTETFTVQIIGMGW